MMTERWRTGAGPASTEERWRTGAWPGIESPWEPEVNELRQEVVALRSTDAQTQRDVKECRVSVGDLEALLRGEITRISGQFMDQERSLERRFEQLRASSTDQAAALRSAVAVARDELEMQIGDVEAQGRDQVDHSAKIIREEVQTLRDRVSALDLRLGAAENGNTLRDEIAEFRGSMQGRFRELEDLVRREDDQVLAKVEKRIADFAAITEQLRADQRATQQEAIALYDRHLVEVARDIESRERSQLELLKENERGMERSMGVLRADFLELQNLTMFREEADRLAGEVAKVRAALDARFGDVCEAQENMKSAIAHLPQKLMGQIEDEFRTFRGEVNSNISRCEHTIADQGAKLADSTRRNDEQIAAQQEALRNAMAEIDDRIARQLTKSAEDVRWSLDDQKTSLCVSMEMLQRDLGERVRGLEERAADNKKAQDKLSRSIDDLGSTTSTSIADLNGRLQREASRDLASSEELRRLESQQRADLSLLQEELRNLGERLSSQGSTLTETLSTMRLSVQSQEDRLQADHAQLRSQVNDLQGELTPQVHAFEVRLASTDKALRDLMRDSEDHVTRSVDAMRAQVKDDAQHMTASLGELRAGLNSSIARVSDTCQASIKTFDQRLQLEDEQFKKQFGVLEGEIETRHKSNHDMLGAAVQAIEKRFDSMKGSVGEQLAGTKAQLVEDNQRISDNLQSITHTIDTRFQEERSSAAELRSAAEAFAIQRGQDLEQRISAMKLNLEEQLSRTSSQNLRNTEGLNSAQALLRDFEQRIKVQMEQVEKTRQLLTDRQDSVDGRFREQVQVQMDTKSLVMSSVQNLEDKLVRQIRDIKHT